MASQWGNRSWLRAGSEVDVSEDVEGDVRTYWQKRGDFRIGAAMFQNEVVENEDDEDQDPEENLVVSTLFTHILLHFLILLLCIFVLYMIFLA